MVSSRITGLAKKSQLGGAAQLPFVWTADPDQIIAAAARGHQVLNSIH
jgi:hypothetical protein